MGQPDDIGVRVTTMNCNVVGSCLAGDICYTLFSFSLSLSVSSFHVNSLLSTKMPPKYA